MENEISEITRRAIFDYLTASTVEWAGRLQEDDFLARLYDLTALPSYDGRMSNAAGDIHTHRVVFPEDWQDDWVFSDSRFGLIDCSDADFLRFLAETAHPVVRPDSEEARKLVEAYNAELAADGWSLVEIKQLSGRSVFGGQRMGSQVAIFSEPTGWQKVDRQLQEARVRLDEADTEEQFQAIGLLCREVLITLGQETYDSTSHPTVDGVTPSSTDVKRMLEAVVNVELGGSVHEEARGHAKAALRLALALQHSRTADFEMAALCAEATSSVVNILAVLAGRRGRSL